MKQPSDFIKTPWSSRAGSSMEITLNLQSPYNPNGTPCEDLPTGEVLAWDGKEWEKGNLYTCLNSVCLSRGDFRIFSNVLLFAPLPTIIENDDLL